jgi:hypothetical protein
MASGMSHAVASSLRSPVLGTSVGSDIPHA